MDSTYYMHYESLKCLLLIFFKNCVFTFDEFTVKSIIMLKGGHQHHGCQVRPSRVTTQVNTAVDRYAMDRFEHCVGFNSGQT